MLPQRGLDHVVVLPLLLLPLELQVDHLLLVDGGLLVVGDLVLVVLVHGPRASDLSSGKVACRTQEP